MIEFEPVIGLECHVQLLTASKAFSSADAGFGAEPNSHTDPYTLALPGTLPTLNRRAVDFALRVALATGCRVRRRSRFARKHYFYPDLPKGYQISQYDEPLAEDGRVEFLSGGARRTVRLIRIHIEEDAGKSIHRPGEGSSLVDLNRAGVPLVEVVSAPDLRSAEEAADYLRALRQLVRYLGICDGNMEEGSLRCDANVSVRPVGDTVLGTRTELKNINSFKFVQRAIEHEVRRQVELLRSGERVVQETRLWDSDRGTSQSMRSKEDAHDYRYFPEPDLPPLLVDDAWIEDVRAGLPALPLARLEQLVGLGVPAQQAEVITADREIADYHRAMVDLGAAAPRAAHWVASDLLGELHRRGLEISSCPVSPAALSELVRLLDDGRIHGKLAKEIFSRLWDSPRLPSEIIAAEGLDRPSDGESLAAVVRAVVERHPGQAEKCRAGQLKLFGFFVGQVMRETGGRADPAVVNRLLKEILSP